MTPPQGCFKEISNNALKKNFFALNDPAQKNPIWETSAHNDPSSEQLKEISQVALNDPAPRNSLSHPPIILKKKIVNQFKEI